MTSIMAHPSGQEFEFSDADFQRIAELARRDFGLSLSTSKKPLVYSRLARRLRLRQVATFSDYIIGLETGRDEAEKLQLLSALTTNVTHFFRESHHFDLLRKDVLPTLVERARAGGRVRIWSAGCSTGQEPYSLAMTLLDFLPDAAKYDVKILATDIDPVVVETARAGIYSNEEKKGILSGPRSQWIQNSDDNRFSIAPTARALITFNILNLVGDWPIRGPFDVIFCRNVAIYFDQATQRQVWTRFASVLPQGGTLIIGHSERIPDSLSAQFKTIGVTAYRRSAVIADAHKGGLS